MTSLVLNNYFDNTIIDNAVNLIKKFFIIKKVLDGYKGYYVGQKISVNFTDEKFLNIGKQKIDFYVIDILIKNENEFGILVVPTQRTLLSREFNPILQELGYTLEVPIDACFFAEFSDKENFAIKLTKSLTIKVADNFVVETVIPKMFKVPKETLEVIYIYEQLRKRRNKRYKLPVELKNILLEIKK